MLNNQVTRESSRNDSKSLIVFIFSVSVFSFLAILILFTVPADSLTSQDLADYIAAFLGSLGVAITLIVAVLAMNVYANVQELNTTRKNAERLQSEMKAQLSNLSETLQILPPVLEAIQDDLPTTDTNTGDRNIVYFRLFHSRMYLTMLESTEYEMKEDTCRDIIGSMEPSDSRRILERTIDSLRLLRKQRPDRADVIDPLISKGFDILAQMHID